MWIVEGGEIESSKKEATKVEHQSEHGFSRNRGTRYMAD